MTTSMNAWTQSRRLTALAQELMADVEQAGHDPEALKVAAQRAARRIDATMGTASVHPDMVDTADRRALIAVQRVMYQQLQGLTTYLGERATREPAKH